MGWFIDYTNTLFKKYERYISPAAFLSGFILDNLTLQRIDLLFENLVLFFYLFIAALGITIVNLHDAGRLRSVFMEHATPWFRLLIQIAFGALFSGYVVFYFRSASFVEDWQFLLLLFFLLVGNEFFKKQYQRFSFQMSIFFIALFSFAIFFLPVVLKDISAYIFLLSGVISVSIVAAFVFLLSRFIPQRIAKSRNILIASIGGLYLLMNIFYFTGSIPPVPLALKEVGVYHRVDRAIGGDYVILREQKDWYETFIPFDRTFHQVAGEPVFMYSAVFAPTDLNTTIFHEWQYFNTVMGEWVTTDKLSYPIAGGRDGGYRGFSTKTNIVPGEWRVNVVTARGQLLGRVSFEVVRADQMPVLETIVR